jgi:anti-anti-sigma factor
MELNPQLRAGLLEVRVSGRLDAHWADHLGRALDEYIRQGHDRVCLELSGLDYVSSMGLRALVTAWKKFGAVQGRFSVTAPGANVRQVLEMAGLSALINVTAEAAEAAEAVAEVPVASPSQRVSGGMLVGEVYALGGEGMQISVHGRTDWAEGRPYCAEELTVQALGPVHVALGLGALGPDFTACRDRFGEYLAVAGAITYQPGDGSNTCDTVLGHGGYAPSVQSLYGLVFEGAFSHVLRFDLAEGRDAVPVSALAAQVLQLTKGAPACVVIAAESAGLIGASLRRSPAEVSEGEPAFEFPALRDWLSFTSEPAWQRMSTVICGVVTSATTPPSLAPLVRPLADEAGPWGHLHAAVFGFHPLPRGSIEVDTVLRPWFEHDTVEAVLHLLADDREGVRESALTRGACWIAPLLSSSAGVGA